MANDFSNAVENIALRSLDVLREQAVVSRLIRSDVGPDAAERGDTITINVPTAATVRDVTPGQTGTNVNTTASKVTISLDKWRESPMNPTDKELEELFEGYIPTQAQENLRALVNDVDQDLLSELYKSTFDAAGTAGTTPFATNLNSFKDARVFLNKPGPKSTPAPMDERYVVLDPAAEGNALVLGNFLQADQRGDQGGIINGQIGRKLGADWFMSQNVRNHSSIGTLSHTTSVLTKAAYAVGATTVTLDRGTLTGTLVRGSLFTLAGDTQQYVVTATATAASDAIAVTIDPGIQVAVASGVAATFVAAHIANLHFQRGAMAMASRPLQTGASRFGMANVATIQDPVSGLVVRAEISRQHKQYTFSWDILYGRTVVRPGLSSRIMG